MATSFQTTPTTQRAVWGPVKTKLGVVPSYLERFQAQRSQDDSGLDVISPHKHGKKAIEEQQTDSSSYIDRQVPPFSCPAGSLPPLRMPGAMPVSEPVGKIVIHSAAGALLLGASPSARLLASGARGVVSDDFEVDLMSLRYLAKQTRNIDFLGGAVLQTNGDLPPVYAPPPRLPPQALAQNKKQATKGNRDQSEGLIGDGNSKNYHQYTVTDFKQFKGATQGLTGKDLKEDSRRLVEKQRDYSSTHRTNVRGVPLPPL